MFVTLNKKLLLKWNRSDINFSGKIVTNVGHPSIFKCSHCVMLYAYEKKSFNFLFSCNGVQIRALFFFKYQM